MDPGMMDRLLDRYPPPSDLDKDGELPSSPRLAPRRLPVEREIDLHGHTAESATAMLSEFIRSAQRDGIRKVLIIHGKGSHPDSNGVLRRLVQELLERNPAVGTTGTARADKGGSGATWAMIRIGAA